MHRGLDAARAGLGRPHLAPYRSSPTEALSAVSIWSHRMAVGEVLDEFGAAFYCEDFAAHAHELFCDGGAESAEPDHEHGGVLGCLLISQ